MDEKNKNRKQETLDEITGLLKEMYILSYCAAQDNCLDGQREALQLTMERLKQRLGRAAKEYQGEIKSV